MDKTKNSSIELDSLLKTKLTKEEKEFVNEIKKILEEHHKLMSILDFDLNKAKEDFDTFEIKTPSDRKYILDEAALFNEKRQMLEFHVAPSEEALNNICGLLGLLWKKFECVREEYPWWGEWFRSND